MDSLDKRINIGCFRWEPSLIKIESNANSFIPFLTSHFSEIYVVDPRYYDEDLNHIIEDEGIDNLLILYNVKTFF